MIIDFTGLMSHLAISPSSSAITKAMFVNINNGLIGVGSSHGGRPFGLATETISYNSLDPNKKTGVIVAGDSFEDTSFNFIPGQSVWANVSGTLQGANSSPGVTWRRVGVAIATNRFKLSDLLEDLDGY